MRQVKGKTLTGFLFTIASAVVYGCMPLLTRFIYADGMNAVGLVFIRNLLSIPMLAAATKISGAKILIPRRSLPSVGVLTTLGCCITPMLLYLSYTEVDTGVATVLHFVFPAVVMLIGGVFLKHRVTLVSGISLALSIGGIAMFYTPGAEIGIFGGIIAIFSGVVYAIYIVGISKFEYSDISCLAFNLWGSVFSTAVSFFICLFSGMLCFPTTVGGFLLCVLLALFSNLVAVVLFQSGAAIIGGERASILSTAEPIVSVAVGIAFLGEPFGFASLIGSALIILASILIAVSDIRKKVKPTLDNDPDM